MLNAQLYNVPLETVSLRFPSSAQSPARVRPRCHSPSEPPPLLISIYSDVDSPLNVPLALDYVSHRFPSSAHLGPECDLFATPPPNLPLYF